MPSVSRFLRRLVSAAAVVALCLLAGGYSASALEGPALQFSIEQVYANLPELDIFVTAADETGQPMDPALVQGAGVEISIGEKRIPTGNIALANEPICYLLVVDNSDAIDPEIFAQTKATLRSFVRGKSARDQVMLYTTAGGPACVLSATDDVSAALRAIANLRQAGGAADVAALAGMVYADVHSAYQSLAPRKCLFFCTDTAQLLSNPALLAGLAGDATAGLNMAVRAFATGPESALASALAGMSGGKVVATEAEGLADALREAQASLANVLEFKTELAASFAGERLDTLTVAVPSLGTAVQASATVYMGHKLTAPAVETVTLTDRDTLTLTFNQAVGNADSARRYRLRSADIWGWSPAIRSVVLSEDGRTATLTVAPLYDGDYTLQLHEVASRITPANLSDSGAAVTFTVSGYPPDSRFYWERFRLPVLLLGVLLVALAGRSAWQRRQDRAAEQQAEAEHLLASADETADALPARWLTLYLRTRRMVAETRWTGKVRGSLLIGSDAAQCDLCLEDARVAPQHCILWLEGDRVLVTPLGGAAVHVGEARIADATTLRNNDVIRLGRTTLRVVF